MGNTKKTMTFEEAMEKLEASVSSLEGGKLTLDEALAVFEEGIALVKKCRKELDTAEQKIEVLLKDKNGEVSGDTVAFSPNVNEEATS